MPTAESTTESIRSVRRREQILIRSAPFLGLITSLGSTSSIGTKSSLRAKVSTSPTRNTMLLQRLRNNLLPVAFRVQASYSTATPPAADTRPKRSQSRHTRKNPRPKQKPTIPDVLAPHGLFQSLSAPTLSLAEVPIIQFLQLKEGEDRGISSDIWKNAALPGQLLDSRIIDALRKCNQFEAGRNYMERMLSAREELTASSLIEAAKFFPLIAIQNALKPKADRQLIAKIEDRMVDLPKSVFSDTARFFLESGKLACSAYVKPVNLDEFDIKQLLFGRDCFAVLAHESMTRKDVPRFMEIAALLPEISQAEIYANKHLHSIFCDFLKYADSKGREQLEQFFFKGFITQTKYITLEENTFLVKPVIKVLEGHGWKVENAFVDYKGSCDACGSKIPLNDELSKEEFETFKAGIKDFVEGLSTSRKSGSLREMKYLENMLKETKNTVDPSAPFLVMDTLNVAHQHFKNLQRVHKLILSLLQHFAHVVLITRPGMDPLFLQKLKRLPISVFFADKRSEDDIFVLMAATEMGPNCYVMTNDFFRAHRVRIEEDIVPLFDRWMARRCVRFNRRNLYYEVPPSYSRTVQYSAKGYHIPVQTKGGQDVPEFTWMCIQKPVPNAQ
ncbi:hypothetical protein QR680_019200 [Steinernema hermaphroditum]|uniref:PRORP domain-containing protein n=1 Tax=Steinernema hermaphroditum TaxID=289476 RepID=A0AA39LS09_9BILA|nr:hypothetical protein QR680_019200 [Steinernema hermaphroditum]